MLHSVYAVVELYKSASLHPFTQILVHVYRQLVIAFSLLAGVPSDNLNLSLGSKKSSYKRTLLPAVL